jgi:CBS-domain-containing membrane protein
MRLSELSPVDVSVPRTATFGEAAAALAASGLSAVAVLETDRRVAGLFTEDDFLAGLFPRYLGELRHTAFVQDDPESAAERARAVADEPIERHMRRPITVEADTSAIHAAEVFLHCEWGAVAVVDADARYVGMLSQVELCRRLLPTLGR